MNDVVRLGPEAVPLARSEQNSHFPTAQSTEVKVSPGSSQNAKSKPWIVEDEIIVKESVTLKPKLMVQASTLRCRKYLGRWQTGDSKPSPCGMHCQPAHAIPASLSTVICFLCGYSRWSSLGRKLFIYSRAEV